MSAAQLINGKQIAAEVREEIRHAVGELLSAGVQPGLASILVGDDPASRTYVSAKIKACQEVGMSSFHHPLLAMISQEELEAFIHKLNRDPKVHAILLQLPLPKGLDADRAFQILDPHKDVDGLHPANLGRLFEFKTWEAMAASGVPLSCTPHGVIQLLKRSRIEIRGKRAVILGRSRLVGQPLAHMLLANDATVIVAHSRTPDLPALCRQADILVAAIGKARFVTEEMVKPGAVVMDVGINRKPEGNGLCGDVDFERVSQKASAITPVPGGVGPMTVAMLLYNTLVLARRTSQKPARV